MSRFTLSPAKMALIVALLISLVIGLVLAFLFTFTSFQIPKDLTSKETSSGEVGIVPQGLTRVPTLPEIEAKKRRERDAAKGAKQ